MKQTVSSIHFCPIKSLSFQKASSLIIKKNIGIEDDRVFAFSRGLNEFDAKRVEKEPTERELINFLTLKNSPVLNKYDFKYENETISILQKAGLDVDHSYTKPDEWIEFAISESHLSKLNQTRLTYDILHEDLEAFYVSRLDNEYEHRDFELGSMGGYYTFAEIEEQLDKLYEEYPHLITEKTSLMLSVSSPLIILVLFCFIFIVRINEK